MKILIPLFILFALCGCERNSTDSAASYLNKPLTGKVSQPGLYRLVRSGGVVNDPNTSTGKAMSKPVVERVKLTLRIPLIKSAQMYFQYRIWPLPDQPAYVDLRRVLKHPAMTLPDGSVSTGSDYMIKGRVSVNQVIAYTGYGLDEDYELVEGDWVFQIWHKDKKLIEQTFTTYRPNEAEQAELKSLLMKQTLTQPETTQEPYSRFNWPGKT